MFKGLFSYHDKYIVFQPLTMFTLTKVIVKSTLHILKSLYIHFPYIYIWKQFAGLRGPIVKLVTSIIKCS